MAKHTSIEVIKSLKLGEGIYQNISVSGDILQLPGIRYNLTDHQWEYNNQSEIDNKWKPFGSGTNKSFIVIDIEYGINGKNYEWELSRYSSSKHVIGGAGKLLKYFERIYKPKSLITYADRRYSQGNLYFKLGFIFDHFSSPNYFYCNNNLNILSRIECQKHKLNKILGDKFNKDLSERENMYLNGYNKIYDCR